MQIVPLRETVDEIRMDVLTLADRWDGGADQGSAHIMGCNVHPCPQCILAEAAIDLREAVNGPTDSCDHEWVKFPNLLRQGCVKCGADRRIDAVPSESPLLAADPEVGNAD